MRKQLLLATALFVASGNTTWSKPADAPAAGKKQANDTVVMRGFVFEDLNGDGVRNTGEPPLVGMPVSDGVEIKKTPPDGTFLFRMGQQTPGAVFVCTPQGWRASKQFYVSTDFERYKGKAQPADIGLIRDKTRLADRFCFVQLTDTHVTEEGVKFRAFVRDLEVVNRITDDPVFVVTTGDLVDRAARKFELPAYVRAIQVARFPFYNVIGNHDYNFTGADEDSKGTRKTQAYEALLGPRYYSFTVGDVHFVAKDSMISGCDKKLAPIQDAWIKKDIAMNAQGKRIIVLQHFLPTNVELNWWTQFNTAAIFSGHWHGRRERIYKGILDVNSAPLRFGGIDRSPRGFRIIHVDDDQIRCEWRLGQQDRRIEIIQPPPDGWAGGKAIDIRVLAYDTAVRFKEVHYRITNSKSGEPSAVGAELTKGILKPQGSWSWVGQWFVPSDLTLGPKRITIHGVAADDTRWTKEARFTLTHQKPTPPTMGQSWPFFHGDAGHRGYAKSGPKPPLSVVWATHAGGTIHVGSPVIDDGRVYIGTGYESSFDDCAVAAIDFNTGRLLWRSRVDSSIKHSPAVHGNNVLAVSQAGTLYCFDRAGNTRWEASLKRGDNHRWDTSFPVTDGRSVFAGRTVGFGAFELATGKAIWRNPLGQDWLPHIYSGPSLGSSIVYQGGPFVRAMDPATGEILWCRSETAVSTVAVIPAVVEMGEQGDRLYVFNMEFKADGQLMCLDGKTGKTIWRAEYDPTKWGDSWPARMAVPMGHETGTPAVGQRVVCLGSGHTCGLDDKKASIAAMRGFDKQSGELLWQFEVGPAVVSSVPYERYESTITSSPVIAGDVVYFGANDGYLYALDVNTGKLQWKYGLALPIASSVAVTGNTLVVATWDGTVYAFTPSSEQN